LDNLSSGNGNKSQGTAAAVAPARRRAPWPLIILATLFVVVPFLTWYGTWFGRTLSDEDIGKYLADEQNPRHVQHALSQIVERIEKRDESVKRWYPQMVALANSPVMEIRQTVAWAMGQDHQSEEFHAALLRLLADKEPIVRRNAATALVRFGDASGRAELRAMLQPYVVPAPFTGTVSSILPEGSPVKMGSLLARIKQADGAIEEVRSPLSGKINGVAVREDAAVAAGDPFLSIAPDVETVESALAGLFYIGEREDLPDVGRYAQGVEGMPERIKKEAALTANAIQSRTGDKP
jgi:hypothetical protein